MNAPAPARSSSGIGRGGVALLVLLVVLGLLIGADRWTHAYAQREVGSRLQTSLGTTAAPTVQIAGFPFLNQVATGRYHRIVVDAGAIPAQGEDGLAVDDLDATLTDVVTTDRFATVTAGRVQGTARIGYAALSRRAGAAITLGYGGQDGSGRGRVTASTSTTLFGTELKVSATGTLGVDSTNQTVSILDPTLDVVGLTLPGSLTEALAARFVRPIPVGALPLGVRLDGVEPTADGVVATVSGTDVKITG